MERFNIALYEQSPILMNSIKFVRHPADKVKEVDRKRLPNV